MPVRSYPYAFFALSKWVVRPIPIAAYGPYCGTCRGSGGREGRKPFALGGYPGTPIFQSKRRFLMAADHLSGRVHRIFDRTPLTRRRLLLGAAAAAATTLINACGGA